MPSSIGIIGGSGFYSLDDTVQAEPVAIDTPFQDEPVTVFRQQVSSHDTCFLPRHGRQHGIPPHKVNYRANLWALKEYGVSRILSVNVVGGITRAMDSGALVIPDQIIDYTWGREHTFFDVLTDAANHVDFTWPYDKALGDALAAASRKLGLSVIEGGVYGCTQGPRLESAAEIRRMARDGCDIVGMTAMPEAGLARELAIPYASIALVVNRAAGLTEAEIDFADIAATLESGTTDVRRLILETIDSLD